jgi:hypothetical protein
MDLVRMKLRLSTLEGLKNKNRKEIQLAEGRGAEEEPYYRTARNPGPLFYNYIFYFMGTLPLFSLI